MKPNFSELEEQVSLLLKADTPPYKIATILNRRPLSIYNTIRRIKKKKINNNSLNKVKARRVSKLSSRTKRLINRDLLLSPKKTNKRILFENSIEVSTGSLQHFLKEEGYYINVATKKPFIDQKNAKLRVKYCKGAIKSYNKGEMKLNK